MGSEIKKVMEKTSNHKKARLYQRFFKTGPGEYGEGDVFIGLTMPQQRLIAKRFSDISISQIKEMLDSPVHEHRMTALIILTNKFKRSDDDEKKKIFDFYIANTHRINNWDLVDVTCPHIVGTYLLDKDRAILHRLARSKNIWKRRIAIVSTSVFIKNRQYDDTISIAKTLLKDDHDLIHKAVGWMLREIGKMDTRALENFLDSYHKEMPRTMLRYSLERLPERKREHYMK